ncbi:MAG: ShlB/FhaC/HecB family hemolysin secretion/activation protein [Gallionellaceae bacterium]|jgi:hemolysin activation/secretion protein
MLKRKWLKSRLSILRHSGLLLGLCFSTPLLALDTTQPQPPVQEQQNDTQRFDITHFNVEGNTLLNINIINELLDEFSGAQRSYNDIQLAINALTGGYRKAGYYLVWVTAPEQSLDQGSVTLHVTEGHIGNITLTGNQHFSDANIRASLPLLQTDSAPRAVKISANAQLANENPAKQVDIILRATKQIGIVDAEIHVIDVNPLKAFLTFDNTGTPKTGNYRIGAGAQHANIFDLDHVATFNYSTSPEQQNHVSLYSGSYRIPLYSRDGSIDFIYAFSDVNAGTTQTIAGPLSFSGRGVVYGMRYNQLLARHGEYSQRLVFGWDYRAYQNNCSLGDFGAAGCGPAARDITVNPMSVSYSGNWEQPGRATDFFIALSSNIPGAKNGQEIDFNLVRPSPNNGADASSHYSILRFGGSSLNAYTNNWQSRAAFTAQYTRDALISSEQFSIAGATAVRGFLEREVSLDTGYLTNLELYTPNLIGDSYARYGSLRSLIFYDFGAARKNTLQGEPAQTENIASLGAGLRWKIQRDFNLRFDWALVMRAGGNTEAGDYHGHLSVYYEF